MKVNLRVVCQPWKKLTKYFILEGKTKRGVRVIMNSEIAKTVLYYAEKLKGIICLKIKAKHHNIVII